MNDRRRQVKDEIQWKEDGQKKAGCELEKEGEENGTLRRVETGDQSIIIQLIGN